jgi:hypothetical protein
MVRSAQTVHLCRVKISTISQRTKSSFDLSLVTSEYHWVCPKRFLSLWYVWRKPCTYLAPTLALSPNRLNQGSTRPTSPWSSIRCVQKWFLSLWYVQRTPCTYLASRLALSPNGHNRASTWASSPRNTIGCVKNDFWAYGMFGANRAPILHMTHVT